MGSGLRMTAALCAWACLCAVGVGVVAGSDEYHLYKDPTKTVNERVTDLLSKMTLEEKVNQLILPFGAKYPEDYVKYNKTGLGATYSMGSQRNNWQRWQVENTRLGIPTSFISETLHSVGEGTVFPMPSLQGASWDTALVEQVGASIGLQASASGTDRGFSPVLHFCTDPRFGRCEESYGEDPMLISRMGVAQLTGLSGNGSAGAASEYLDNPLVHIATEAKHFGAYGYGGRDGSMPAEISDYTLYDVYMKPWRAYAQAGGRGIMAAHNEVNGMPCHGNHELLTEALRNTFGFGDGLCASDAGDIKHITAFHIAPDPMHAGAMALKAGMDQELDKDGSYPLLPKALQAGLVNMSDIDRATGNVLRQKIACGMLDGRADLLYVNETRRAEVLDQPKDRLLARTIAEEAMILLQNSKTSPGATAMLPLVGLGSTIKNIAVIGPNADNAHSTQGGYTEGGANIVTVLQGVVQAANASGNKWNIEYERGACLGMTPDCPCPAFGPHDSPCGINDTSRIPLAASMAKSADLTILVIGDSSTILAGDSAAHEETATCGEHFDRDNLDPPAAQMALLRSVVEAAPGKVCVVLIHGRTVTFGAGPSDGYNSLLADIPSVLATWRPGEEAGNAVWRILNGTVNPSGRTTHTWPRTVGQVHQYVPWFLPWATRSRSNVYADMQPATPLFPFGHGLSYSTYAFSDVSLSATSVTAADEFEVSLNIKSSGPAGKCVVQVYFSQELASRVRFGQMLLGFAKVAVPANSQVAATVRLRARDFEMWDKKTRDYVVEPGVFNLMVGQSSTDKFWTHLITVTSSSA